MELMLDLETLSVRPNATILSIGAVAFNRDHLQDVSMEINDLYPGHKFYKICHTDQDRDIEEATMSWWMNKGEARQEAFLSTNKVDLKQALGDLHRFIKANEIKEAWSYGSIFDLTIITDAFKQHKFIDPLAYRNKLCFRTFRNVAQSLGIDVPRRYLRGNVEHNALHDAISQTVWLQDIWLKMKKVG